MRIVGTDQISRAHGRPVEQRPGHSVVVLVESGKRTPRCTARHPERRLVLRNADEPERPVVGERQPDFSGLDAVDIDERTVKVGRGVQDGPQYAHVLEELERTRLHTNGFRVERRYDDWVDDAASDATAGEFNPGRQADAAAAGNQDVGIRVSDTRRLCRCPTGYASVHEQRSSRVSVHSGQLVARRLRASGIDTVFTLSGGHLFPIYDGCRTEGVRLIDTRHEQTAAFAAEGWSKVTRVPGVAALTAGPGVTNGMSAMAAAQQNQSPMLVLGGRAPAMRWGMGSLQEIDHVPFVAPLTRYAGTARTPDTVPTMIDDALRATVGAPSGVAFVDFPMDDAFGTASGVDGRRPARCTPCLAPTPQTGRRWRAQSSSSPRRSAR